MADLSYVKDVLQLVMENRNLKYRQVEDSDSRYVLLFDMNLNKSRLNSCRELVIATANEIQTYAVCPIRARSDVMPTVAEYITRANWNLNSMTAGEPTPGDKSHYSCGAVVGFAAVLITYTDNYRNPAMKYNENIFFDYTDAFSLYDQANASASSPLTFNEVDGANYNYPYHGKAAPAGKTLSEVAKSLGWSTSIWDFSGELPKLK